MPLFTSELSYSDDYPTIEPSLNLDFANSRALDSRITFTRASTATYVGRDGLIKTAGVNEPRFDHDPDTGESLGLLIEESRTNLIDYSTDFQNQWAGGSATNNQTLAPDGTSTAAKYAAAATVSLNKTYTSTSRPNTAVKFNLATGTYDSTIVGTPTDYDIEPYGNGWYRCYFSVSSTTFSVFAKKGELDYIVIQLSNINSFIYARNATDNNTTTSDGIYIWGAQIEDGSFPTSYIPTSGSTATREKEFPTIETSSIDFHDFSQGGEGTLLCEFSNAGSTGSDIAVCFSGDTHNGATFVGLGTNSNRNAFNRNRVDATNNVLSVDSNFTTTGFYKVAFGIGQSRCTLAVRGSSSGVLEDTSVSYDSTPYTKLILGCDQTSSSINNMINGTIKSVFYYPTLLSDTQLQTLTQ